MINLLIGTPDLAYVRRSLPHVPDCATRMVEDHQKVIANARKGVYACLGQGYDIILTELSFTPDGLEGFHVLEALKDHPARKILWTDKVSDPGLCSRAKDCGADALFKDELGTLAGIVFSRRPLKVGGQVLIYVHDPEPIPKVGRLVRSSLGRQRCQDARIVVSNDLVPELRSGRYGLVIDTTAMGFKPRPDHVVNRLVAQMLAVIKLSFVPRVVCVTDPTNLAADISAHVDRFLQLR